MSDKNYDRPIAALLNDAAKLVGTAAYRLNTEARDEHRITEVVLTNLATLLLNIESRLTP